MQNSNHVDAARDVQMVHVYHVPLGELMKVSSAELDTTIAAVREQVARPRKNLGGTGPPGRAD